MQKDAAARRWSASQFANKPLQRRQVECDGPGPRPIPSGTNKTSKSAQGHEVVPVKRSTSTKTSRANALHSFSLKPCETELPPKIIDTGESKWNSTSASQVSSRSMELTYGQQYSYHSAYSHHRATEEETISTLPHVSDFSSKSETAQQEEALVLELTKINKEIKKGMLLANALGKLSEASKRAIEDGSGSVFLAFQILCYICFSLIVPGSVITAKEMAVVSVRYGQIIAQTLFGLEHEDYKTESLPCRCAVEDRTTSNFLAAVHILSSSAMCSIKFVMQVLPRAGEDGWKVLKFIFGLAGSGFIRTNKGLLRTLVTILGSAYMPESQPIIKDPQFLYLLTCLHESNDIDLFRQLLQDFIQSQTIVLSTQSVESYAQSLAMFVSNTLSTDHYWTLFAFGKAKFIPTFIGEVRRFGGAVITKELEGLGVTKERDVIIITTRNLDYLQDTVSPLLRAKVSTKPDLYLGHSVYGHLSSERYKIVRKLVVTGHFNMVKDSISPHLAILSMQEVPAQYKKNDHIWFRVKRNVRHEWYGSMKLSPCIPVHWVKVPQPNGNEDLEQQFKIHASSTELKPGSRETAELVLLNSQPLNVIEISTPGRDLVTFVVRDQDEVEDQGFIGSDFLMEKYFVGNVSAFECKPFDIKRDVRIGRVLPLPPNKVEMAQSTTLAQTPEGQAKTPQGQFLSSPKTSNARQTAKGPLLENSLGRIVPKQTKPYMEAAAAVEDAMSVSEHEIKREAMNGFDRPGHCFYGDQVLFKMAMKYTLPDKLPNSHILREGGNGTVYEVKYSGEVYAVKKTAFRWREVLIMPKLRHKNILKLVALMIGEPLENHSKRRYVYHLYPKLSNDLGRSVGSFEKHCLRTLMERYQGEPLLLKKIKSNFCHVAREVLLALDYLHTRPMPIVHRDVKASNVLVRMACSCHNPLLCVCRNQPGIVISDFDASLELSKDGTLVPDPPRASSFSFHTSSSGKLYHVSAVGTIGYKSPEGSMYAIGNHLETMPPLSTKADIFSFGNLMALLFLNQDGPKHQKQLSQLLLFANQTVGPRGQLSLQQKEVLKRNKIHKFRLSEIVVPQQHIERILPIGRAKMEFKQDPAIISFLESTLAANPSHRWSARELLRHSYLKM